MTGQNPTSSAILDITLEVDLGAYKVRVSGNIRPEGDISPLVSELTSAIAGVIAHKTQIEEALKEVKILKSGVAKPTPAEPPAPMPPSEIRLPSKGRAGILEFSENDVRYPPSAFKVLGFPEAIALLMYEVDAPLMPARITLLVNRGFKHIDAKNVSSCLTNKTRYKLPIHVIREKDGWRLTGAGKAWVESEVVPKLREVKKS